MRTPEEVVRAVAVGVCDLINSGADPERERRLDTLADCYAERTRVTHPLDPSAPEPMRTRAELRRHFAATRSLSDLVDAFELVHPVVHRMADPELVVFEFGYRVTVTGPDGPRSGELANVYVVRVRDGEIVESRDYADHAVLARLLADHPDS